ncbi:MAG: phosphatidylglycerol lysyltransferase domain-containing protein [Desulfobacterales bacterium]|nr:phosphatidylglycerol lysyltransferase domain-containing protein [Desulfobacterales bacterium]
MKFKNITPADYHDLVRFFDGQKYRLCTYSLTSILAWSNQMYQPYGAIDGQTLFIFIKFTRHEERNHLILPVSPGKEFAPEELNYFAARQGIDKYCFVPESYIQYYGRERVEEHFEIADHEGFSDYVYRKEDLAELEGSKYSKKRNLIHQFDRSYFNRGRVAIGPITVENAQECVDFLEKWCEEQNCEADMEDDFACEKQAAKNTLENIGMLHVRGILARIDGEISAIGIGSHLTDGMGVLHFEKAFSNIKGLYQFFDRECARRLFESYQYINKENDMNIPGLIHSKKSYFPAMIVKAYRLILR